MRTDPANLCTWNLIERYSMRSLIIYSSLLTCGILAITYKLVQDAFRAHQGYFVLLLLLAVAYLIWRASRAFQAVRASHAAGDPDRLQQTAINSVRLYYQTCLYLVLFVVGINCGRWLR